MKKNQTPGSAKSPARLVPRRPQTGQVLKQTVQQIPLMVRDLDGNIVFWNRPAEEVHNLIRGLSPFPGAWFTLDLNGTPTRIKALRSTLAEGSGVPGTVLPNLTIACGPPSPLRGGEQSGAVRLTVVQREGKGPMDAATFLRGAGALPGGAG